jgi:hypothetical protein
MPLIDPSPDPDELADLARSLKSAAANAAAYLKTPAGQADPNFGDLTTQALNLYTEADNVATSQLQLGIHGGGQAVDAINAATAQLTQALKIRNDISSDLNLLKDLAAFAAAIAAGSVGDIITSGQAVVKDLKPGAPPQ